MPRWMTVSILGFWICSCGRGTGEGEAATAAPQLPDEVLETLPTTTREAQAIDPQVAEHLVMLAGEIGEIDFPSTREVIERCREGDAASCSSL